MLAARGKDQKARACRVYDQLSDVAVMFTV